MARKVILDVDPGIDDALALTLALFDPRLEVVAVTAAAGNVGPEQALRNVQAVIDQLDPPRLPRIGAATASAGEIATDARHVHGPTGLGSAEFQVAELHQRHAADKVIVDEVRAASGSVTIVALAPLTNIARALHRDPQIASQIGHLIIMGGAVTAPGNVTPAAEFNIYCDPMAARFVFRSPITTTLVPLDVTSQLVFNYDFLEQLPPEECGAGKLLRRIMPYLFWSHRQHLGQEGIHLHDAVALLAATDRELFETRAMAGDVETGGTLTIGATVFDRRRHPEWRPNMDVATAIDTAAAMDCILRGLAQAGR
jgi:inosine-uridine nucleoside N-ribohydrolase